MKEKKIVIAIPAEDVEYVESLRVYNVKIPESLALEEERERIRGEIELLKISEVPDNIDMGNVKTVKVFYNRALEDVLEKMVNKSS